VQGLLGRTPWATTYAALTVPNRHVALKLFDPALTSAPGVLEELEGALMGLTQVSDSVVLRPIDAGEDVERGMAFVVTSLCHYPTLAELVSISPLGLDETASLLARLGKTLDTTVPHLGLKPTNVFVGPPPDAELLLADFGIDVLRRAHLRALGSGQKPDATWLAPEQGATQVEEPARADVYAAGLLACFALTGKALPNTRGAGQAVAPGQHATAHGVTLSGGVIEILVRALAVEPSRRFASVSEFASALRGALGPRPTGAMAKATARHARATGRIRRFRLPGQASIPPSDPALAEPTGPPPPTTQTPTPGFDLVTPIVPSPIPNPTAPGPNLTKRLPAFDAPPPSKMTMRGVPKFDAPVAPRAPDKTQRLSPFFVPTQFANPQPPGPANDADTARRAKFSIRTMPMVVEIARRHALILAAVAVLIAVVCVVIAILVVVFRH
jgi:hypothetical protein